jgi:outer membrane receptor protein involved in Fe transport
VVPGARLGADVLRRLGERQPQLATNVDGYGLFTNGANARSRGVEAETEALLGAGWDLSVNSSYTAAKFLDSDLLVGFPAGTAVPDTPKWTGATVLHWDHELYQDRSLFAALEADYVGGRTDAPYGTTITVWNASQQLTQLPAYTLINVKFGV